MRTPCPVTFFEDQKQGIVNVRQAYKSGSRKIILPGPTGSGKTHMAGYFTWSYANIDLPVLFVAHREELIHQPYQTFTDAFGLNCSVIMGTDKRYDEQAPIQIASLQTLTRREYYPPAAIVIYDEAHRACSESAIQLLKQYPDAFHLFLTATPIRLDGKPLRKIADTLIDYAPRNYLIEQKRLAPLIRYTINPNNIPTFKVKGQNFDAQEMGEFFSQNALVGDIIKHWRTYANHQKTLVFNANVKQSLKQCEAFKDAGINAAHIDATTSKKERAQIQRDFRYGEITLLCNVGIFVEGIDIPETICAILNKKMRSLTEYMQSTGRVGRTSNGKPHGIVIDHAGNSLPPWINPEGHGHPDLDRKWTLNDRQAIRGACIDTGSGLRLYQCPRCLCEYSFHPGLTVCRMPDCDEPVKRKPRPVAEIIQDRLVRREKERGDIEKEKEKAKLKRKQTHQSLMRDLWKAKTEEDYEKVKKSAAKEGYKPGWIYKMRERKEAKMGRYSRHRY